MPSITDIANYSFDMINQSPISDLEATDAKSQKCKRIYDIALAVLADKDDWKHGTKRVSIATAEAAPLSEWTYSYAFPADCAKPQRLNDDDRISWEVNGRSILTNEEAPIMLEYVCIETNPNKWSGGFTETFTAYLASRYAKAFPQDNDKAQREYGEYKESLGEATAKNGQVGSVHRPAVVGFTGGRRY